MDNVDLFLLFLASICLGYSLGIFLAGCWNVWIKVRRHKKAKDAFKQRK